MARMNISVFTSEVFYTKAMIILSDKLSLSLGDTAAVVDEKKNNIVE
jgi:hypothetical protein